MERYAFTLLRIGYISIWMAGANQNKDTHVTTLACNWTNLDRQEAERASQDMRGERINTGRQKSCRAPRSRLLSSSPDQVSSCVQSVLWVVGICSNASAMTRREVVANWPTSTSDHKDYWCSAMRHSIRYSLFLGRGS
jgi:hypothetical protein